MTRARAFRLAIYSGRLGYDCEVVTCSRRGVPPGKGLTAVVKVRRPGELWGWCYTVRDWVSTIRYYRDKDRTEKQP